MIRPFLGFALVIGSACSPFNTFTGPSERQGQIELRPCRLLTYDAGALCAKHAVFEDRAAKAGRVIEINVLILPALARAPAPDPVFFIAGGPGQGAARIARAGEDSLMRALRAERDLVFIDQRGTGDSHRLICAATGDRGSLQYYFREIFDIDMVRSCRRSLEERADLKFYTTLLALEDIEEIRRALGYDKINLHAVSYGTLGALEYLRRYPEHVRSAVLAGVASPAAKVPLHFARSTERAMHQLIAACAEDESCRSSFPRLQEDLDTVLNAFARGPVRFELEPPGAKTTQTVALSRGVFVERLRLMLYDHSSASLLPLLIHRAAQGDWRPFGQVAVRPASAPAYTLSLGTYLTITCSESVAFIDPDEIGEKTANTLLGDYRTRRHQAACAEWPRGDVSADFFLPVKTDVPVLLLSGDIDPATPQEFAKIISQSLPNSRHIVLRNTPHNYHSDCARRLAIEFIKNGLAEDLNPRCAEGMRRPPFHTELPERYR
jgi:pimeloyl-ACP methyl ester carboxylesterase